MLEYVMRVSSVIATVPGIFLAGFGQPEIQSLVKSSEKRRKLWLIGVLVMGSMVQLPVMHWEIFLCIFFLCSYAFYESHQKKELQVQKYRRTLGSIFLYGICCLLLERMYFAFLEQEAWEQAVFLYLPFEMLCILLIFVTLRCIRRQGFHWLLFHLIIINGLEALAVHMEIMQTEKCAWTVLLLAEILCNAVIVYVLLSRIYTEKLQFSTQQDLGQSDEETYEYYLHLDEMQLEVRKMYHDMKNRLMVLEDEARSSGNEKLKTYTEELKEALEKEKNFVVTGRRELDVFFYKKQKRAAEQQTDMELTVKKGCLDAVPFRELIIFLSNAIDNALEECLKLPQERRKIEIRALELHQNLMIFIKNPVLDDKDKSLETHKHNKRKHGFGLLNMTNAVEQMGGLMSVEQENGYFQVSVLLEMRRDGEEDT